MATLSIGVMMGWTDAPEESFAKIREMGLRACQLANWNAEISDAEVEKTRAAAGTAGVTITLLWRGYSGPTVWNYIDGPSTIGLVPPGARRMRTDELKRGVEVAQMLGVPDIATHVGFLPMNPKDPDYLGVVDAVKEIADHAGERGVHFDFETGQETPMVLLRCFNDVGRPNLGINLDPANLLMYGNANPVDALDIFGQYIRGVHAKDGVYPTNGYELGHEMPLGDGRVNFPVLVHKLKSFGYAGSLTIEREISGPQQVVDIKRAIDVLTPLL